MKYKIIIWVDKLEDTFEYYYLNSSFYKQIITSYDESKEKYMVEIYG